MFPKHSKPGLFGLGTACIRERVEALTFVLELLRLTKGAIIVYSLANCSRRKKMFHLTDVAILMRSELTKQIEIIRPLPRVLQKVKPQCSTLLHDFTSSQQKGIRLLITDSNPQSGLLLFLIKVLLLF